MNKQAPLLANILLLLSLCAVLATAIMLFGARFGLWEPIVGFGYYRNHATGIAITLLVVAVVGLIHQSLCRNRSGIFKALLSVLVALALLGPVLKNLLSTPARLPPIHDITTDTEQPPAFIVLDDQREGARNSLVHGGAEVIAQQKAAYPDIAPIETELSPVAAYDRALELGRSMGWQIVAEDRENLRFEATARTPVFHFADDVVVTVSANAAGSQVDLRSVSRIGRGDRGVNAARIRSFMQQY